MKLNFRQKVQAAFSAVKHRNEIKQLLIRRYWQNHKTWKTEVHGVTALFNTSDFFSNMHFWQHGFEGYEPAVCEILARLIKNSRVYADVGGNVGFFSVLPALINRNCKIFYFEGDSTIRPLLIRNMELNQLSEERITIINAVVGDREGEIEYRPHPYSFLAMYAAEEDIDVYDLKCHARVISLDDYFRRQGIDPDLLKIDVDGSEMSVLRGMSRILKETKPDLLLEVHPPLLLERGSTASEVCDFLRERNYRFFLIPDFRNTGTTQLTDILDFNNLTQNYMIFATSRDQHRIDPALKELMRR